MLIEQWSQDLWHHTVIHSVKLSRMVTFCLRKVSLPVLSCPITCRFPLSFLFINYSLSLPSSLLFIAPYLFFLWSVYFTEFRLLEKNADGASSELVYQLFLFLMFGQMNRGNGAIKLLLSGDGNKKHCHHHFVYRLFDWLHDQIIAKTTFKLYIFSLRFLGI